MKRPSLFSLLLMSLTVALAQFSAGQVSIGMPPFGSFGGGPFDTVDLGNLNVNFTIPVFQKAGRGMSFSYPLLYDSSVWTPVVVNGSKVWQPSANWGWQGLTPAGSPYISDSMTTTTGLCGQQNNQQYTEWVYGPFVYFDELGTSHTFNVGGAYISSTNCGGYGPPNGAQPAGTQTVTTTDASGLTIHVTIYQGYVSAYLTTTSGTNIYPPIFSNPPAQQGAFGSPDANGNEITSANGTYTDTLGTQALSVVNSGGNTNLTYTPPSVTPPASYVVTYHPYTVSTAFGCGGIADYTQSGVSLVDRVMLPDGTFYQFAYETTAGGVSGRLSKVTLPTGGSITYAYTGGNTGIFCADGSTSGLSRADLLPENRTRLSMILYCGKGQEMTQNKFSEAVMIGALKQLEAGRKAEDVGREVGVSKHTIYAWK
jgi:hypothetical protein